MVFFFVLIVLIAPPVILAGLIVLAVLNSQKKQMIRSLQQENEMLRQELGRREMQPVGVQPVGVQPVGVQPMGAQPQEAQPVGVQPVGVQPVGVQPQEAQPVGVQPMGVQPQEAQPVGVQPVGAQPMGVQPMGVQPVGVQPVGVQPQEAQPVGVQPVGVQPVGVQPQEAQPVGVQPMWVQPQEAQPVGVQPIGVQPQEAQPVGMQPIGAQPQEAQPMGAQLLEAQPLVFHPIPTQACPASVSSGADTNWQGTAALVMGVVFVILAGAIFATTAWHLLPNVGKVALVLAFSGIFFGASAIAQHKLHITGTGKAFYILGSVFLFVAALAVGFFGLLGPELTLWGRGRYLVLFAGTVMTETALVLGLRRFREIIYGGLCLFGITIAAMLLLASFHPGRIGFTAGMAVYGVAVVLLAKVLKKHGYGNIPQSIAAAFPVFSLVNLWGISALVLLNLEWGALSGGVTLLMAGLHLYLGETGDGGKTGNISETSDVSEAWNVNETSDGRETWNSRETSDGREAWNSRETSDGREMWNSRETSDGSEAWSSVTSGGREAWNDSMTSNGGVTGNGGEPNTGAFALLLAAGILRAASPDNMDSYLYTGALVLVILAAMSYMGLLSVRVRKILRYAGLCMAAILLAGNALSFMFTAEATLAGVICMGLLLLDATLLALEYRRYLVYSIYSVMLTAFLYYLLFYMELDIIQFLFWSGMIFGSLFLAARMFQTPFKTLTGDALFAVTVTCDAGVLWLFTLTSLYTISLYLMAAGTAVMLTAMLALWSREYKAIRYVLPLVPSVLPWMIVAVLDQQFGVKPDYDLSQLIFLLLLIAWDLLKKDRFCAGILVLGSWYGAIDYLLMNISLPYFLVLALYMVLKGWKTPKIQRTAYSCISCVYIVFGAYAAYAPYLEAEVTRELAAAAVLGVLFLIWKKWGRELSMGIFFQSGFTVLYLAAMGAFYWEYTKISLWYLVPLGLLFAAAYLYSFIWGRLHLHFLAAVMTMALPMVLRSKYDVPENWLYIAVMAASLLTAVAARTKYPLISFTGEDGKCMRADWYHMLLLIVLLPMTLAAPNDQWRTVYLLLMAAYVMQYATVKPMARGAVTLAEVICLLAFWIQPWIQWPVILTLEICLIPTVAVIWSLGRIWGNKNSVRDIQTFLYTLCLLTLAFDAYLTQKVADALILEGICLSVFTVSCVRKCRRPAAISGSAAVAVVIYMTRGFWLSLSWWVYLLAAGIGLILFAAVNEMKKH